MDGGLKPYRNYREYTDAEIRDEQDEYFANDNTKAAAPGLFNDRDDITYWIKDGDLELLDMDELNRLRNSDIKQILAIDTSSKKVAMSLELMKHYGKDYKSLANAFTNNQKLPPPLVIRDKNDDLWLMAGNSRMMMAASLGYNMPVKVVKYTQELRKEGIDMDKIAMADIAKKLVKMHGLKTKVKFDKSNNKADYDWDGDVINVDPRPKSLKDFIHSVLHEIDHAMMRKRFGAKGYEWEYTQAGQKAVDQGKNFYWDNPFEIQAEKYAEKNLKKYIKKLNLKK